jgi:hypothetical protein
VATTYQTVVCSVHLGLIRGALAEFPIGVQVDRLEPFAEPGACVGPWGTQTRSSCKISTSGVATE